MIPASNTCFLPPPRVADVVRDLPDPEQLDDLLPGSGEVVRQIRALHTEATEATEAVIAGRPGGTDYATAVEADLAEVIDTGLLKKPRLPLLLDGENARWSRASILCRALVGRVEDARTALDSDALARAIRNRSDQRLGALDGALKDAYHALTKDDRGTAWTSYYQARDHAEQMRALDRIAEWLAPTGSQPGQLILPGATAGYWHATRMLLGESRPVLRPQGVTWPPGFDPQTYTAQAADAVALAYGPGHSKA